MDKRTTWILLIVLLAFIGLTYFVTMSPAATTYDQTATYLPSPIWSAQAADFVEVRFEDLQTMKYVHMQQDSEGNWFVVGYFENTPTPTLTSTPSGTPTIYPTDTATPSATWTSTPESGAETSATPTPAFVFATAAVPTKEGDTEGILAFLWQLANPMPDANLGEDLKPSDFDLDNPSYRLILKTKSGFTYILEIGARVPLGTGYYARMQGAKRIYVVSSYLIDPLIRYIDQPPFRTTPTFTPSITLTPSITETPDPSTPTSTPAEPVDETETPPADSSATETPTPAS